MTTRTQHRKIKGDPTSTLVRTPSYIQHTMCGIAVGGMSKQKLQLQNLTNTEIAGYQA